MGGFGETLPYHENKATLDKTKKDKWGLNVLAIDCELKENELKMRKDMMEDGVEMLEASGVKNVRAVMVMEPWVVVFMKWAQHVWVETRKLLF